MITQENVVRHELIGLRARVEGSSNGQLVGLQGTVVYETMSMLHLDVGDRRVKVPKAHSTWSFVVEGDRASVDGNSLRRRPHDRLGARR